MERGRGNGLQLIFTVSSPSLTQEPQCSLLSQSVSRSGLSHHRLSFGIPSHFPVSCVSAACSDLSGDLNCGPGEREHQPCSPRSLVILGLASRLPGCADADGGCFPGSGARAGAREEAAHREERWPGNNSRQAAAVETGPWKVCSQPSKMEPAASRPAEMLPKTLRGLVTKRAAH